MSGTLVIQNRQRALNLNLRLLRRLTTALLAELSPRKNFELGICLVGAGEMAGLNETFLRHEGPTDVITFDYSEFAADNASSLKNNRPISEPPNVGSREIHGEIFVCADEAISQARRFRTTWQSELARYVIHGVLHLNGHDDLHPAARRKMKLAENRLLLRLGRRFDLADLSCGAVRKSEIVSRK